LPGLVLAVFIIILGLQPNWLLNWSEVDTAAIGNQLTVNQVQLTMKN